MSFVISAFRSSFSKELWKKNVLKNFAKFTRKHLCQNLFLSIWVFFHEHSRITGL